MIHPRASCRYCLKLLNISQPYSSKPHHLHENMRLLKTYGSDPEVWRPHLVDFRGEEFAILSHRWLGDANDEVLFADIQIIDDGNKVNPKDHNDPRRHTKYQNNPRFSRRSTRNIPGYEKLEVPLDRPPKKATASSG
jgi:hypothetical protein